MSAITLSAAVRSNLLALQDTTANQSTTQQRLATGKKVNSALDNPTNYFTAAALSARAGQLTQLLDSMTNGINTIKAASNGLDSITTTLQSMQATVTQARQDASWQAGTYSLNMPGSPLGTEVLTFSGGAVPGSVNVNLDNAQGVVTGGGGYVALNFSNASATLSFNIALNGGSTTAISLNNADLAGSAAVAGATLATAITAKLVAANVAATASFNGTNIVFTAGTSAATDISSAAVAISGVAGTNGVTAVNFGFGSVVNSTTGIAAKSVDQMVSSINTALTGQVKAASNAGQLQIFNLSTATLTVVGIGAAGVNGGIGAPNTQTIGGNTTRSNLVTQFNNLKDQLDKTAADASFNGINLLAGDQLKLYFNENSSSSITIQSTNPAGINASTLGVTTGTNVEFQSNTQLDTRLAKLQTAVLAVASQASNFGTNLSIVQNRQTFTNNMINTLQTGADGLTLADGNLEGANMLALQTRQQLSVQALSLASQANQAVLKLFG